MLSPVDLFFQQKSEPSKSCLEYLRHLILSMDKNVTEKWRYGMPFYFYGAKRFCYLWTDKKSGQPYIGLVDGHKIEHPDLVQEQRARMKILPIDSSKNIPVKKIRLILDKAIHLL